MYYVHLRIEKSFHAQVRRKKKKSHIQQLIGSNNFGSEHSPTDYFLERNQRKREMASKASTPTYPSAARISDSPCYPQYSASLKCKKSCLHLDLSFILLLMIFVSVWCSFAVLIFILFFAKISFEKS